jgi:hypothetical protein
MPWVETVGQQSSSEEEEKQGETHELGLLPAIIKEQLWNMS